MKWSEGVGMSYAEREQRNKNERSTIYVTFVLIAIVIASLWWMFK